MFEFGVRILLAGALVLLAGTTSLVSFPLAVGVAVGFGILALAAHALHSRGLYEGAGAGLHGGLEGLGIALLLTDAHQAETLGFVAMLPYAWCAVRHRAGWTPGAFAVASVLVGAHALLRGQEPTLGLCLQAGGVLGLGLLLSLGLPASIETAAPAEVDLQSDEEMRGRFRALREAYTVLERRTQDDAHTVAIVRAVTPDAMAQCLRDATGATGAAILTPGEDGWCALGTAGNVPETVTASARTGRVLQERGATLLFANGRPVGAAWVPESARDGLAALAPTLAARLADRLDAETERKRRQNAELRVTLIEGGDSPDSVARALASLVGADSVEFGAVGPLGATPLGHFGPPCPLPEALRHESGPGLAGWAASGSPLVWISDARGDERLDGATSLRARTATLALVPLADGRAYAWAAWHTPGIGRPSALATMRAAEPVVGRWLQRAKVWTPSIERMAA